MGYLRGSEAIKLKMHIKTDDKIGERSILIRLKGTDDFGNEYTTDYILRYTILDLPVSVIIPEKWVIGNNIVKVSELKGESKIIYVNLLDKNGVSIYYDSYKFSPISIPLRSYFNCI